MRAMKKHLICRVFFLDLNGIQTGLIMKDKKGYHLLFTEGGLGWPRRTDKALQSVQFLGRRNHRVGLSKEQADTIAQRLQSSEVGLGGGLRTRSCLNDTQIVTLHEQHNQGCRLPWLFFLCPILTALRSNP
jgi:hypothetical protein